MKILLIDPYSPSAQSLNTSLGWLSASVHKAGHEVFVLDLNCRRISNYNKVLRDLVERYQPEMIGITVMCTTYTAALLVVQQLKDYFPGHIVLGGAQMSFERENALKESKDVDFAIVGEGEETFVELIENLENKQSLDDVHGLIFRKNGKIISNSPRKAISDLNQLPFPDYRLFGLEKVPHWYNYRISTSRRCPYHCVYCNPHTMRGKWKGRDFHLAIEEIEFAKANFCIRRFDICEPVFNLTVDRVIEFSEHLIKADLNLPWTCNSGLRADKISDEMIKVMKRSGFYDLKIGVETLSPKVFSSVKKGETIEDILNAVEVAKRNGLRVSGSFILGLPGSTYKTVMESFMRAQTVGFDEMPWSMLIPYPGTPVYHWVLEHGTMYYDYKNMHQYVDQDLDDDLHVPFDTPEFPLADRLKAWNKIHWTLKKTGLSIQNKSMFWKAWKSIYSLARYDPFSVRNNISYIKRGAASIFKRRGRPEEQPFLIFNDLHNVI